MSQFPPGFLEISQFSKMKVYLKGEDRQIRAHFCREHQSQRHRLFKALNAVLILTLHFCSRTEPSVCGNQNLCIGS